MILKNYQHDKCSLIPINIRVPKWLENVASELFATNSENDTLITDSRTVSDIMNRYFINVGRTTVKRAQEKIPFYLWDQ